MGINRKAKPHLGFILYLALQLPSLSMADIVTCYTPNGTSFDAENAKICNSLDGTVSMCCAQSDECLNNGLCKIKGDESSGTIDTYWRDMCSLSSWPDIGCLKVCEGGTDLQTGNSQMTPCDGTDYSETWCCGDTHDCCEMGDEVFVPLDIYATSASTTTTLFPLTPTKIMTKPTPKISSTMTLSALDHPSSESDSSRNLSIDEKVGVGVGVSIGVIAIAGATTFFIRRPSGKRAASVDAPMENPQIPPKIQESNTTAIYEKPAGDHDTRHESFPGLAQ
ncbi:hypothetical protein N7478_003811 [Penicillium angulare]|uniref:uncharacterized protein n=1 Tax=Penicillium angulare TaxID=116970 RepID=UPI00253F9E13|nr:uncharacterized protein N7478_010282 [Penicillium angulare]XP_056783183.1 uncharacterized protein N7478_003811 [Penicillium angulare]KAJ5267474.1 hypothetical protein N7478_010282 [Penicillium angulare]KAJ5288125.1 hypothetical protein N7478_003811 [Penicillium angulare]